MATQVSEFLDTKTGGFVAGLAIGTGAFLAVRFGPKLIIARGIPAIVRLASNQYAQWVVNDVVIGRFKVLDPQNPVGLGGILVAVFNVLFYLFGGVHTAIDIGKDLAGVPVSGTGKPHELDSPTSFPSDLTWIITSVFGLLQVRMPNMARVDP